MFNDIPRTGRVAYAAHCLIPIHINLAMALPIARHVFSTGGHHTGTGRIVNEPRITFISLDQQATMIDPTFILFRIAIAIELRSAYVIRRYYSLIFPAEINMTNNNFVY
jgi:hypothetical protein